MNETQDEFECLLSNSMKNLPFLPHISNIFEKLLSKYLDLLQQPAHTLSAAKDLAQLAVSKADLLFSHVKPEIFVIQAFCEIHAGRIICLSLREQCVVVF